MLPTGLTLNNSSKTYPGYTVYGVEGRDKVIVLNMDGNIVHTWEIPGISPVIKPLPGGTYSGICRTPAIARETGAGTSSGNTIGTVTLCGNLGFLRVFHAFHHDLERLPNGNTLVLGSQRRLIPAALPHQISDDVIMEVNTKGKVIWRWSTLEHFQQLGLSAEAIQYITDKKVWDVFHTNSIQSLPENQYAEGDSRFAPGNILVSQRNTNIVYIIDKSNGNIVWTRQKTVGQHHASMVGPALVGGGNITMFDNGSWGGYPPVYRYHSKVLEINPMTKAVEWQYSAIDNNMPSETFFSSRRSSAQRLPNGNTLIVESVFGRIFEVTRDKEIVWEYLNPEYRIDQDGRYSNQIYRAYRVDYSWPGANWTGRISISLVNQKCHQALNARL